MIRWASQRDFKGVGRRTAVRRSSQTVCEPVKSQLRVDFELLRVNKRNQVPRIAQWLSLPSDDEGFTSAVAHAASWKLAPLRL